jgi:hypothetical protein
VTHFFKDLIYSLGLTGGLRVISGAIGEVGSHGLMKTPPKVGQQIEDHDRRQ